MRGSLELVSRKAGIVVSLHAESATADEIRACAAARKPHSGLRPSWQSRNEADSRRVRDGRMRFRPQRQRPSQPADSLPSPRHSCPPTWSNRQAHNRRPPESSESVGCQLRVEAGRKLLQTSGHAVLQGARRAHIRKVVEVIHGRQPACIRSYIAKAPSGHAECL